jgi:hypothetical protein
MGVKVFGPFSARHRVPDRAAGRVLRALVEMLVHSAGAVLAWQATAPRRGWSVRLARALPFSRFHTDRSSHLVTAAPPRATALHIALVCASLLATSACSGEKSGAQAKTAKRVGASVDQESYGEVVIAPPPARYAVAPLSAPGAVSGIVELKAPLNPLAAKLAPLSPMASGRDSALCGKVIPDSSLQQKGSGLGHVVVWLDGVRNGKPIPLEKRLELESDHCMLTPRVQAAVVGSAVNVIGHDDFRQHLRFIAAGDSQPRVTVLLGSDEQVIPTNLPANAPGMVIVKDADHPWPRAYLAVFDHPYYAVTKPDGSFVIDGVPPGKYSLVAWHERTGKKVQTIEVGPGATAKVTVALEGK